MHVTCLTVEQRERFNEIANRDENSERIRSMFDQEKWMSNSNEVFWMTTEQKDYLLSIWDIIT